MKRFVEGADRGQGSLFPQCLDDWIGEDNPIRVIDVFVDELNLGALGFSGVYPKPRVGLPIIAVALHSDFRSQVHFVEFLRQSVLGVFQRYRRKAEMPTVRRFFRNWMKRGCNDDVVVSLWYP